MTVEEAKKLNKGDYVFYKGQKYKVLHTQERRANDTNEVYIAIKCSNKNETLWLPNKFAEDVNE
jgi:hypothetical protein